MKSSHIGKIHTQTTVAISNSNSKKKNTIFPNLVFEQTTVKNGNGNWSCCHAAEEEKTQQIRNYFSFTRLSVTPQWLADEASLASSWL